MPGLFTNGQSDGKSDSIPHMFAPPSRFSTSVESSARHVTDASVHETRKRGRPESGHSPRPSTSNNLDTGLWPDSTPSVSRFSDALSPPPLANERYQLAGGMEQTPMSTRHTGDYDDYFQLEKQRGMWTPSVPSVAPQTQVAANEVQMTPNGTKPWVLNQILSLVGGVAGSLVQFCSRPFRGFQAGGGQGYTVDAEGEITANDPQDDPFVDHTIEAAPIQTLLPGKFPEEDYGVRSIDSLETERPRLTKRLRTGENWVMVGQDGTTDSRPSTPRLTERRVPSHTRSPSQIPRPVARASMVSSIPRPSLIPVSRRSTLEKRTPQSSSQISSSPYSTPRTYNPQTYGSPAMFPSTGSTRKSPLPPESQRLINERRRAQMDDDARLRRMSMQMSQMLKEAQEALGSKVEMDDDYGESSGARLYDEGYSHT